VKHGFVIVVRLLEIGWLALLFCSGFAPPSMFEVFIELPTPVGTGLPLSGLLESQPGGRWSGERLD